MKKILTVYPNCSLGGMTSVYISRCMTSPDTDFDFIFINDRGGAEAFATPENSDFRIVRKDRLQNYYINSIGNIRYDEIRITSLPELTNIKLGESSAKLIYEIHTSTIGIIEKELQALNFNNIDEIWVPSEYLKNIVLGILDKDIQIKVVENITNTKVFHPNAATKTYHFEDNSIPVFWVGRLDKGKNYKDFFRMLALLPEQYQGIVILSLENEPSRISEALLETDKYGINHRVKFLLNLTQNELADLYRDSFENHGIFCSTSLAESFGYGVLEAALCGLPVVTYEVGGISGHKKYNFAMHMIDVGDTVQLAKQIRNLDWDCDHNQNIHMYECYLKKVSMIDI